MKEVKVGLVGLGFMGSTHFRIHNSMPGVKVVALADIDPVKRTGNISSVVGNIGGGDNSQPLDLTGVQVFDNGFEMIEKCDLDMVDICVPTVWHKDLIIAGLEKGIHVFCEKPLCRSVEEVRTLKEKIAASKSFINIGMCVRAWPEYDAAKKILDSGSVGKVLTANFRRLSPRVHGNSWKDWYLNDELSAGVAYDTHLHDSDFIRYLFGRPVSVTSIGLRGAVTKDTHDHIFTSYNMGDKRFITAECGWCAAPNVPFEMSFQIVCEKATLKFDHSGFHIYWNEGKIDTPDTGDPALPTGWHRELKYFTDCVREGVTPDKFQTPDSVIDGVVIALTEINAADCGKTLEIEYV